MTRDNIFVLLVSIALISAFETHNRQDREIKACQSNIEAIQEYLLSKFPPSDHEKARTLGKVMDLGRRLQESLQGMSNKDRDMLAFAVYDFAGKWGDRFPKWLGGWIKSLTGIDLCNPDEKVGDIKQLHAMLALEAQSLDYGLLLDFRSMHPPYYATFPDELAHFLDSDIQPAITSLLQTSPDHTLHFLIPSPTPAINNQ